MATYKIAPDSTGEIGMAQMKYGLVNKADYNNSNGVTTEINMETLVVNSTTYQGDLTSKTWNTSQPYGFGEMYGQTWSDVSTFTLYITDTSTANCAKYSATVKKNGTVVSTITKLSTSTATISTSQIQVLSTDTILIEATAETPTGVGCIGSFSGTDLSVATGTQASYTTRFIVSSINSNSYSFNPNSTTEFAIRFNGVPTL